MPEVAAIAVDMGGNKRELYSGLNRAIAQLK